MICEECNKYFETINKKRRFCGKSCASIHLHKVQPELRYSKRTKNSFIITRESLDYINGLLLGDAHIQKGTTHATRLIQTFSKKYEEWACQVKNDLKSFGIQSNKIDSKFYDKRTQKIYYRVFISTLFYPELAILRNIWYTNDSKKIPEDLVLNNTVIRNWFLGDGYYRKSHSSIQLSTENFKDIDIDIDIIKNKLNTKGYSFRVNKDRRLHLYRKKETNLFLENINFKIPSCFSYKFNYE